MPEPEKLTAFNEDHAAAYDQRFAKLAPLRDALSFLMKTVLSGLPENARVLCVGAGTGLEIAALAERFPAWHFTAVEPSAPMLAVCRRRAENLGLTGRCAFHEGYLDSLPRGEPFDAATSLLVSQFVLDREARRDFFRQIAARLRPGGFLVSADLSADIASAEYERQLSVWLAMMIEHTGVPAEQAQKLRDAYQRDVSVLPPGEVAALIESSGFEPPTQFLQTLLIHGWFTRRRGPASC